MYKVFFRIVYGLIAALGLILTYNYTDSNIKKTHINRIGFEALETESYETFVPNQFYNSDLLVDEVLITKDKTLRVMLYEVVQIGFDQDELIIDEGLFVLIHQLDGIPLDFYYSVTFTTAKNTAIEFLGVKVASLPIYTAIISDTGSSFIDRSNFVKNDQYEVVTQMAINVELEDEPILTIPLNITNERFQLKDILTNYYETNAKLPETSVGVLKLAPVHIIDTTKWVLINMAIYMMVVTIVTIIVFTFRKRKLGKKTPTPGLTKDLRRIEKDE